MLEIQEYVDIRNYSSLHIGGQFRYFSIISSIEELNSFYAIAHNELKYKNIPIFILGGGSNIVFSDGVINVFAIKMEIKGFDIINDTNEYTDIKIGAGEIWDEVVAKIVSMNLSGFQNLSAIPGTVGATPIQNVGAYGSEVKDTILEIEVFDIKVASSATHRRGGKITVLSNKDCKFGYRDSIFKGEAKGKYIVTSVTYRLSKSLPKLPDYPGVKKYFIEHDINSITLKAVREAIINIRKEKLPDPKEIPNVGSFFKNPIITKESFSAISRTYGRTSPTGTSVEIPHFDAGKEKTTRHDLVKIPAGWLIENAGLKGKSFGNVSVYDKNALVLVNKKNATCEDIISARDEIIKIVKDKFGITLEQEPEVL